MKLSIIYEDKDLIVVEKPAGLPVHATNEKDARETLASLLVEHYPPLKNVGENSLRPGIVHRLDKETSGLMVIAKNNETFFELKKQFQQRRVGKKYIALVSGVLQHDEGVINTPLVKMGTRTRTSSDHTPAIVGKRYKSENNTDPSRAAVTEYKIIKRFKDYTLVEITPKTGRQHQIRVHFTSINHPVACDKLYGRKSKKCPPGLARHFLHASYLSFRLKSALMEFESELPEDLSKALQILS